METERLKEASLPLLKALAMMGGIAVAVAVGVFTITRYATDHQIASLQHDITARDAEIQQLRASDTGATLPIQIPQSTLEASPDKPEVQSLVKRIGNLESERSALLKELLKNAKNALDPKSELFPLVAQLDSSSDQARTKALTGLFALRDPRSVPYLVEYYNKHPREATRGFDTQIWEWFNLLLDLNKPAGLSFILGVFAEGNEANADFTYKYLRDLAGNKEDVAAVSGKLKDIALRNRDELTRTRAKLLLQYYQNWGKPGFHRADDRSIIEILLDIEHEVKSLRKGK